jgi:hypothetical protein
MLSEYLPGDILAALKIIPEKSKAFKNGSCLEYWKYQSPLSLYSEWAAVSPRV